MPKTICMRTICHAKHPAVQAATFRGWQIKVHTGSSLQFDWLAWSLITALLSATLSFLPPSKYTFVLSVILSLTPFGCVQMKQIERCPSGLIMIIINQQAMTLNILKCTIITADLCVLMNRKNRFCCFNCLKLNEKAISGGKEQLRQHLKCIECPDRSGYIIAGFSRLVMAHLPDWPIANY